MTVTLMSRCYAGLLVELTYTNGAAPVVAVQVTAGDEPPRAADVPPDRALDAFYHPFVYLPPAAVAA